MAEAITHTNAHTYTFKLSCYFSLPKKYALAKNDHMGSSLGNGTIFPTLYEGYKPHLPGVFTEFTCNHLGRK